MANVPGGPVHPPEPGASLFFSLTIMHCGLRPILGPAAASLALFCCRLTVNGLGASCLLRFGVATFALRGDAAFRCTVFRGGHDVAPVGSGDRSPGSSPRGSEVPALFDAVLSCSRKS